MEKFTLLFVLIASVEWAYSAPLDVLTLGGDVTSGRQSDLDDPNTAGPLKSLEDPLGVGHIANSVELGVEYNRGENGCGDGKDERNDHCESCGRNDDYGNNGCNISTEHDNKSDDCGCNEKIEDRDNESGCRNNESCGQTNESGGQDNENNGHNNEIGCQSNDNDVECGER